LIITILEEQPTKGENQMADIGIWDGYDNIRHIIKNKK